MSRTVYINGEFVPESEAKISIMDRGYLFADGVYEVSAVINGKMIDNEGHLRRLERSLGELDLRSPLSNHEIEGVQNELIERNGLKEGIIYLQITRGVAERDFLWPEDISPTLTMFTQAKNLLQSPLATKGLPSLRPQTSAGKGATLSRSPCFRRPWQNTPPEKQAPTTHGWWTMATLQKEHRRTHLS